jgi:hypothetical protein
MYCYVWVRVVTDGHVSKGGGGEMDGNEMESGNGRKWMEMKWNQEMDGNGWK